jgi:hypothetical protein
MNGGSIVIFTFLLLLISTESIFGQGPPPPGGVRIQERQNGPPDSPDISLVGLEKEWMNVKMNLQSKKVLQTVAKHIEGKLPNLNTEIVVKKVKTELGLGNGRK